MQTMRGHPLLALTTERKREGGKVIERERERERDNATSRWTRVNRTKRGAKCRECGL